MKRAGGTWIAIGGLGMIVALAHTIPNKGWNLPNGEQGTLVSASAPAKYRASNFCLALAVGGCASRKFVVRSSDGVQPDF
jgi:hypothetical protein